MSSKKRKGDDFRDLAKSALEQELNTTLKSEQKLFIGTPGKEHAFDLASKDQSIVIECKNYTWTKTGRVPSAKISTINEAVLYFSFLDENVQKILCLMKSEHLGRKETLAEYYGNTYKHLLRDIIIYEVSKDGIANRVRPIASL